MFTLTILAFFALAHSGKLPEGQFQKLDPNCDMIAITNITTKDDFENNTIDIQFGLEKLESSKANTSEIKKIAVRHGPVFDGKLTSSSKNLTVDASQKLITLKNVAVTHFYGFQACAIGENEKFQGNIDHAPVQLFDVIALNGVIFSKLDTPDQGGKTLVPRCNLVQTAYVAVDKDAEFVTVTVSWEKRQSSYDKTGQFGHYQIRHGPQSSLGAPIAEREAIYEENSDNLPSVVMSFPLGSDFHGFQICALISADHKDPIDWQNDAWLGSIDLRNYISESIKKDDRQSNVVEPAESSFSASQVNENMDQITTVAKS